MLHISLLQVLLCGGLFIYSHLNLQLKGEDYECDVVAFLSFAALSSY